MSWFSRLFAPPAAPPSIAPKVPSRLSSAVQKARTVPERRFPVQPPTIPAGVVPQGHKAAVAMDGMPGNATVYEYARAYMDASMEGFPGYPYLAALATRAEYRAFASSLSTEITREWITINSSDTSGDGTKRKITEIVQAMTDLGLQQAIKTVAEHDSYFGRGQIFIDLNGAERSLPLVLDKRTVKKGSLKCFRPVEPMWTTPSSYNALDPAAPDFYKPSKWFMLGQEVHASRLLTVITRPVPDLFKPAFNFSGMSMSQLAEPYVNNWLRTRQSVADLISNFSIVNLSTAMEQVIQGSEDGADLFMRADLFTATRSNRGLMLTDKNQEELSVLNVPLGGLHELQAQSQEHMCAVSRIPAIILTGISPSGLNASSKGEIKVFYDWTAATQESDYRSVIDTAIKLIQLNLYGEIDPDITFSFDPLYQMTPKELSEIRKTNADAAGAYIDRGVLAPEEERERLARDPESGYQGLDVDSEVIIPDAENTDEEEE